MKGKALWSLMMVMIPASALAYDGTWVYATADKYATAYYSDQVRCLDGDRVNVWLKVDVNKKGISHFKKQHRSAGPNFKYFIDNKTYDCRQAKSATYQLTTYAPDGMVLEEASWKESEVTWSKVAPDSNDDFIMEELCMVCSARGR